jgi:hypothetical protein
MFNLRIFFLIDEVAYAALLRGGGDQKRKKGLS